MSLFTEKMDRYYVGKMIFGLLFVVSFLKLLIAGILLSGLTPLRMTGFVNPQLAFLQYGIASVLWYAAFRFVESRRRRVAV